MSSTGCRWRKNLQTHTIPPHAGPGAPCQADGLQVGEGIRGRRQRHAVHVRRLFESVPQSEPAEAAAGGAFPREFAGAEAAWKKLLAEHSFGMRQGFQMLREFLEGPGYVPRFPAHHRAPFKLLPRLFALCPKNLKFKISNLKCQGAVGNPFRIPTAS